MLGALAQEIMYSNWDPMILIDSSTGSETPRLVGSTHETAIIQKTARLAGAMESGRGDE